MVYTKTPVRWQLEKGYCYAYKAVRNRSSSLHGHHHFLLTFIICGEGVQTLNGHDIPFGPGDLFLLSPADFHKNTITPGSSFTYYGLKFTYELFDDRLSALFAIDKLPVYLHLDPASAEIVEFLFKQLVAECTEEQKSLESHAYLQAIAVQLMILILRNMKDEDRVSSDTFTNRALGYLHSHFCENITLKDAADFVGYSPNYFNSSFNKHLGMPFMEYLRQMRLNYAKHLLRSSQISVTEVAHESGFNSLYYFSRCFRNQYGESPQQYRKNARETEDV